MRRRKMAHSSVKKQTVSGKKKQMNPNANPVIAKHWDKKLTVKQNYARLGLAMMTGKKAGGVDTKLKPIHIQHDNEAEDLEASDDDHSDDDDAKDCQDLDEYDPANIPKGIAKMQRDAAGNVVRVIYGTKEVSDAASGDAAAEPKSELAASVIRELEEMAAKPKRPFDRRINEVDEARLLRLRKKHGDDYHKMQWDRKLNPMQLSAGALKRQFAELDSLSISSSSSAN